MRSSSAGCGCPQKKNSARSAIRQGGRETARLTDQAARICRPAPPLERRFQIVRNCERKEGCLRAHSPEPHWSYRRAVRCFLRLRRPQGAPGARPYRLRFAKDLRRCGRESSVCARSNSRTCRSRADRILRRDPHQGPALSSAKRLLCSSRPEALGPAMQPSRAPRILQAPLRKHAGHPGFGFP